MAQYSYPGNQNNRYDPPSGNRRKYPGCIPTRGGKSKHLEWVIFWLFVFDVFCQIMGAMAVAGVIFWWLSLGDSVVVLMFIILLIVAKK